MNVKRMYNTICFWTLGSLLLACSLTENALAQPDLTGLSQIRATSEEWQIQGALAALQDRIPEIQVRALEELHALEALDQIPESARPDIARLLEHPNEKILATAATMVSKMGKAAQPYLPQLTSLLHHPNPTIRAAAIRAIGNLQEQGKSSIPRILELLNDHYINVRLAAARALSDLGEPGDRYAPQIVALLQHPNWEVRAEAAALLGSFGQTAEAYVPQIAGLLKENAWEVRAAAITTLGNLGTTAQTAIPQIVKLLSDANGSVRMAAVRALGEMGTIPAAYQPQIVKLLKDQNWEVRAAAISVLGHFGEDAQTYLPQIINQIHEEQAQVQAATIEMFGALGQTTPTYLPQIMEMLKDDDWEVRAVAVKTLGNLGGLSEPAIPQIAALLSDRDWYVRANAVKALGNLRELAASMLPKIAALLNDRDGNVRTAAIWALGNFGERAQTYKPQLTALLTDSHPGVRSAVVRTLGNIQKADFESVAAVINLIPENPSQAHELRFLAHLLGAGNAEIETFLKWVGAPAANYPNLQTLSYADAHDTLTVLNRSWEAVAPFPRILAEVSTQIAAIIGQMKTRWTYHDVGFLRNHLKHLEAIASPHAKTVSRIIMAVIAKWIIRTVGIAAGIFHPLLWLILLLFYPTSRRLRITFFWNPYIRTIGGLGYIHLLLVYVPFLRRRLFQPFRKSLLSDAAFEDFDETAYFDQSEVYVQQSQQTLPIYQAIPKLKGKIWLEGESGAGKTTFIRALLKRAKRPTVYLPAEKCARGVIEAIQSKLLGEGKDFEFLKTLVYRGALDICIDGLNQVNADICTDLSQFIEASQGNLLVAAQPLAWDPPTSFRTYRLQPLASDQIEAFLITCHALLPDHITISWGKYAQACRQYLGDVLNARQPQETLTVTERILANPMNLTMIALLGVHGKHPELLHLQEQYYQLMADEYERVERRPFPLAEFSRRVYAMRIHHKTVLSTYRVTEEIIALAKYKMVLSRPAYKTSGKLTTEWYFRHETILEFFLAHALRSNQPPEE